MYSRGDMSEYQGYPHWLNPMSYENVSADQVDWAALAQQWISMKDAEPNQSVHGNNSTVIDATNDASTLPSWIHHGVDNNTGWPPPHIENWNWDQGELLQAPQPPPWNAPVSKAVGLLPTPAYRPASDTNSESENNWSKFNVIKPHNRRYSKVNVAAGNVVAPAPPIISQPDNSSSPISSLDAIKRKQLPAWIREGLEKMERDKQKMLEKEKEKLVKQEYDQKLKQTEKDALEILKTTLEDNYKNVETSGMDEINPSEGPEDEDNIPNEQATLTEEQMRKVRRTMTDILLKVTNKEIRQICEEEFLRFKRNHKASGEKYASTSTTASKTTVSLGLGMYGGESETSDSESESDSDKGNTDDDYSGEKLNSDKTWKISTTCRDSDNHSKHSELHEKPVDSSQYHINPSRRGSSEEKQVDAPNSGNSSSCTPIRDLVQNNQSIDGDLRLHESDKDRQRSEDISSSRYAKLLAKGRRHSHISSSHSRSPKRRSRSSTISSRYSSYSNSSSVKSKGQSSLSKSSRSRRCKSSTKRHHSDSSDEDRHNSKYKHTRRSRYDDHSIERRHRNSHNSPKRRKRSLSHELRDSNSRSSHRSSERLRSPRSRHDYYDHGGSRRDKDRSPIVSSRRHRSRSRSQHSRRKYSPAHARHSRSKNPSNDRYHYYRQT